jgi:hypothetical protein
LRRIEGERVEELRRIEGKRVEELRRIESERVEELRRIGGERSDELRQIEGKVNNNVIGAFMGISDEIRGIMRDDSRTLIQRIQSALSILTENKEVQELRAANDRLLVAVCSQLRFIEEIAVSSDIESWVIVPQSIEQARARLLSQAARIEEFIAEIGNTKSQGFFDGVVRPEPSIQISEYLRKFESPKTPESRELFVLVLQTLTANEILKKYAVECKAQASLEVDNIREELEAAKHQMQTAIASQQADCEAKVKEHREGIRSILRESGLKGNTEILQLLDVFDSAESGGMQEQEYAIAMRKKLRSSKRAYAKLQRESESAIAKRKSEIGELKAKLALAEEKIDQLEGSIEQQKEVIQSKEAQLSDARNMCRFREEELEEAKTMNAELAKQIQQQEQQQQEEVAGLVESFEQETKSFESQRNAESERMYQSLKRRERKLKAAVAVLRSEREEMDSELQNLRAALSDANDRESEANRKLSDLGEKLGEIQGKTSQLTLENRLLTAKLARHEEALKRERTLCESHVQMQKLQLESNVTMRVASCRDEAESRLHQFLTDICHLFSGMIDVKQQINVDRVHRMLVGVRQQLRESEKAATALRASQSELQKVRQLVAASPDPISRKPETGEWENWAKNLFCLLADDQQQAASASQLRRQIEVIVHSRRTKRQGRYIELLRAQKLLMLAGAHRTSPVKGRITIRGVVLAVRVVVRSMRLVGAEKPPVEQHERGDSSLLMSSPPLFKDFVFQPRRSGGK